MSDHDESEECTCIGPDDVILRELRVLEILSSEDGQIYKVDLSSDGTGEPLSVGGYLELAEWSKAMATAPMMAEMVMGYMEAVAEDDE